MFCVKSSSRQVLASSRSLQVYSRQIVSVELSCSVQTYPPLLQTYPTLSPPPLRTPTHFCRPPPHLCRPAPPLSHTPAVQHTSLHLCNTTTPLPTFSTFPLTSPHPDTLSFSPLPTPSLISLYTSPYLPHRVRVGEWGSGVWGPGS